MEKLLRAIEHNGSLGFGFGIMLASMWGLGGANVNVISALLVTATAGAGSAVVWHWLSEKRKNVHE